MRKLRALSFSILLALAQFPAAPAWAQQPAAPAPAQAPMPPPAPAPARTAPQNYSGYSGDNLAADVCISTPLNATHLPPSLNPPQEWRNQHVTLYVNLRQDGSVADVHVIHPSDVPALDAAAIAQVKQSWRWAPLACNRTSANAQTVVLVPRQDCNSRGFLPSLPLTMAQPGRSVSASVDMNVQLDGRMTDIHIADSSGNAALDAALLAHIRQNAQYWPLGAGCPVEKKHLYFRFPEESCIPKPVVESRSLPTVAPSGRPRAIDLQIGVAPTGEVLFTNLVRGSGDDALDAATMAHVKAAWRWQPIACKRVEIYARQSAMPVIDYVHIDLPARQQSASR